MRALCLDFGNTRYKYAIFNHDTLIENGILPQASLLDDITAIIKKHAITKSILSSVVAHHKNIELLLAEYTDFHCIDAHSKLPFTVIKLSKNDIMGADRLALCAAATISAPTEHHSLIISAGTCITYNFLDYKKTFLGGSIAPGIRMRYRAMHEYTHLLPLLTPIADFPLIGYDTPTHLHSGVLLGTAAEIDGIISLYQRKYTQLFVCLTGGDAEYLVCLIKNKIFVDYSLLLKGLYIIGTYNWKV